jgi:hypothetical protein
MNFMAIFFHGNPKYFHPNDKNPVSNKTFGDLYLKTKEKQANIEKLDTSMFIYGNLTLRKKVATK